MERDAFEEKERRKRGGSDAGDLLGQGCLAMGSTGKKEQKLMVCGDLQGLPQGFLKVAEGLSCFVPCWKRTVLSCASGPRSCGCKL